MTNKIEFNGLEVSTFVNYEPDNQYPDHLVPIKRWATSVNIISKSEKRILEVKPHFFDKDIATECANYALENFPLFMKQNNINTANELRFKLEVLAAQYKEKYQEKIEHIAISG